MSAALTCVVLPVAADAATFTVDNTDDSGAGSLRQAILDANASAGTDTIVFTLAADSTITLASDLDALTGPVTIDASGAPDLSIDGDANRILRTDGVDVEWIDLNADMGDLGLGDGDVFTFTANADSEIGADIHDADLAPTIGGALVKQGDAILVLSGANDFTGGISIDAGTLVGDVASLPGDIENDGALVFDQAGVADYLGVISGSGSLEKTGSGILGLNAPSTYTGGTLVSEGALVGSATTLPGDVEVADAATLGFVQFVDGDFAGDISGDGRLVKTGPADLRLSGSNSYSDGTVVAEGTLTGDSQSLQGDMDLAGGNLVFDQAVGGSFGGDISGTGSVTKQGAGNLSIAGSNSYTGGTTVEGGTLTGNADAIQGNVSLMAATTLVFDQNTADTFDGAISGMGDVVKQGGGTLTIDTPQTYTGNTTIMGGVLELSGTGLTSPTTVESGGTLSGNGAIAAPVVVRGTLTPGGTSQDIFMVLNSVDFEAGSRFVVDMDASDGGDTLSAWSAVVIDPTATIEVRPAPGDYSGGSTATVLMATSVTGSFLEGEPFAFLDRLITYPGGDSVQVTLIANGANLATIGQTPNQIAVGTALSTLTGSLDPDVQELFDNLNTLTASQAAPTLDSLSGESLSAFSTARVALGERMQRTVQRRMRSLLFASSAAWPAGASPDSGRRTRAPLGGSGETDVAAPPRLGERGIGAWLDGYGVVGTLDGDGNSADVDYGLYGTTAGVDYRLGSHVLAGAAAGYARTELQVDARNADGNADTAQGALYAAWANRRVYAGVSGRYAWSNANQTRDIVAGSLRREARADFDSHDYGVRGELAVDAFEAGPLAFEPLAGFEWNHLTREDFQESGAGGLGLDVDSETLDTSLLQLGARLHGVFPVDVESVLTPELRGYWLHEFGDDQRLVDASLDGAPFRVSGAEAPRDSALVGIGWAMSLGPNVRAAADYDLRIDSDRMEHLASITVRVRF